MYDGVETPILRGAVNIGRRRYSRRVRRLIRRRNHMARNLSNRSRSRSPVLPRVPTPHPYPFDEIPDASPPEGEDEADEAEWTGDEEPVGPAEATPPFSPDPLSSDIGDEH